jgi:CRISPR-associated endonuclease/helicase Cas3
VGVIVTAESESDFRTFFQDATGFAPYEWQVDVATNGLPEVLPVPTGLGKTEGVTLGWAWRRLSAIRDEPRHLVYCLPMRTLVRQTTERLARCFAALRSKHGLEVAVHQLMAGAIEDEWARWPDKPWVLVGTQDQLLSRALNRGYAMSRFEWPVHFGLLNQDCRWIIDEVQLMGPGLWTTAQLDWMRQKRFASVAPCRTTWMSATVGPGFLATTDRKRDGLDDPAPFDPKLDKDKNEELQRRRPAKRAMDWFAPNKDDPPLHEQLARVVAHQHVGGTLSLVICNTVEMARQVFLALPDSYPKVLLTSRFRRQDRDAHEQQLLAFEARRHAEERRRDDEARSHERGKPIADNPGLICISTQVVEAGVDVSAHQLWSELAPWPSVIQRLGRLNRDGRDQEAYAWFWETPPGGGRRKETRIGPYEKDDVDRSKKLLEALAPLSEVKPFDQAIADLARRHKQEVEKALQPKPAPMPRALDVHGLFSTERDVHGGITDVSAFVRGADPDADLTVFWRDWERGEKGAPPPSGEDLDGPPLHAENEGCPVPFYRLREMLKPHRVRAWVWNDDDEAWESIAADDLRPGMVVMLHHTSGGYDAQLGWTGNAQDRLVSVPKAGRGRALRDAERTETGYWGRLDVHLGDARREAETLCDALDLKDDHAAVPGLRTAVVEASALHDLGKAHPQWQNAVPAASALTDGPWAKCPRVVAVDAGSDSPAIRKAVHGFRADALLLGAEPRRRGREDVVRLRWAVGQKLTRAELESLSGQNGVHWVGHVPFRPGLRHEAASALATWRRYREGGASYPALSAYLAATHHGKVRTVLRSTTDSGEDVFGVPRDPGALGVSGEQWPLDFSVAKDGAEGTWTDGLFTLTGHGWTGLVADLLGPWRAASDDLSDADVVPAHEPRRLGPFVLAYLEALVRVADWRASERPSQSIMPAEVSREQ